MQDKNIRDYFDIEKLLQEKQKILKIHLNTTEKCDKFIKSLRIS